MKPLTLFSLACVALFLGIVFNSCRAGEWVNGITWEAPVVVTPGEKNSAPPSDAIVLFDGKNLSKWINGNQWKVENGIATPGKGKIISKESFGDCQIHLEWSAPDTITSRGQGRGNSGLFLMGLYEIQILDSYKNKTYHDGQAGAIYKQAPPQVNAMRKPTEWNSYDIIWTAPRFNEEGSLKSPAYITAIHNGVLIQNHFQVKGNTFWKTAPAYTKHPSQLPISLQDHGSPVQFRNIWVRKIGSVKGTQTHKPGQKRSLVPIDK